jgi:NADH:ubiquinone reductase (H+-translocating)
MARTRIVVLGGGYVGMYTAIGLERRLNPAEASITVIDPRSYMTYQPFLPEAASGSLSPRQVVVPLRRVLKRSLVLTAMVVSIDNSRKRVTVRPLEGEDYEVSYDVLVVALGSVARTLDIPGLADWATGFKNVEEAIELRNGVIECLDIAESARDEKVRERALTFVFVGGGYAGVEAMAELEDLAQYATRYYSRVAPSDMHWVLVEAAGRILPEVGEDMGDYTLRQLRERGIDVRLNTRLESCIDGAIELSDGSKFEADTLVWTAGVKANPVLAQSDLPLDERGRLKARADLRVEGLDGVWVAGDSGAIPDLTGPPGAMCGPSAQHAVRQAKQLAANIATVLRGGEPQDYMHRYAGSVASLGLYRGVAEVYGVKVRGFPAWFMHRTYHVSRMPTFNRKARVIAEWTLSLFLKREVVSLWGIRTPITQFTQAPQPGPVVDLEQIHHEVFDHEGPKAR